MEPDSSSGCAKCGQEHPLCAAHEPETDARGDNTGFWRPCKRQPKAGDLNCWRHRGPVNAPLANGRAVLARHRRPMGNVLVELKALFEELSAVKEDMLAQIEGDHFDDKQRLVFSRCIRDLADVGGSIAKMQVDERLIAIKEGEARMMAALVMRVLGQLELPAPTLRLAQKAIASEMAALAIPATAREEVPA